MQFDHVVIVEDNYRNYYPLSISTPLSDIVIGGLRYYEHVVLWLMTLGYDANIYVVTRSHLARYWQGIADSILARVGLKYLIRYVDSAEGIGGTNLVISTSLIPQIDVLNRLISNAKLGMEVRCGDRVLLSVVRNGNGGGSGDVVNDCDLPMAGGIWSVIRWNTELLRSNSKYLLRLIGGNAVDSDISRNAVIDERAGDVIAIGATVEPLAYVRGPSLLGPGSRVLPHAYIREGTVLYMGNAVGGEVKNSIMDMHSLKEHFSYLGDSYVGRWVNIGAGSVTSNLKNTIGVIRYMGIDTGMIKLGSVIGDWAKIGINTSIMSGKYIGQGSSVVGLIRRDVPPFSMCINGECERFRVEKAVEVYRRFAELRRARVNENEVALIRAVYELSLHEPPP